MKTTALLALLLAGCIHFPPARKLVSGKPAAPIVIADVRVFAATSAATLEHQDVLVEDGLIAAIAPAGGAHPAGALVLDGRGRTLLPGLVDLHVHTTMSAAPPWYLSYPNREHNLQAHLYAGVTTVLDLGGPIDEVIDSRMKIAHGEWLGPRVLFAGPIITARGGYPVSMIRDVYGRVADLATSDKLTRQVTTADEATLAVRESWLHGASIIKVVVADIPRGAPRLSEELLRAIVHQAAQLGLGVAAHIDNTADALLAARVGIRHFAHGVTTSALTAAEARTLADAGCTVTPTLINFQRFDALAKGDYLPGRLVEESESPELLAQLGKEQVASARLSPAFYAFGDEIESHEAARSANAKAMFDAGMPVLAGTDANGSVGSFPGAIHDELQMLVDAGIPPVEVLLGATARAARFLSPAAPFGTIEVGKSADLLLVEGNPLEQIAATRKIVRVIVRGVALERTPLH